VILPPHEWHGLIQKVHSELGHFGVKHIYSLSLFITIGEACMFKFEMSLLGVNNVTPHAFSTPYSGHVLLLVM